jgi:acyl carrier protein
MSTTPPEIREQVRGYLRDNLLYMRPDYVLQDQTRLLEERIIDSMGIMELIGFLEQQFGVTIPDKEVTEANLGSVDAITAFVGRRLEAAESR